MIVLGSVVTLNSDKKIGQLMTVSELHGDRATVVFFDKQGVFQEQQIRIAALSIKQYNSYVTVNNSES